MPDNQLIKYEFLRHTEPKLLESSREVWGRMFETAWREMKKNIPEPGHTTKIEMTDGPRFTSDLPERIMQQWRKCLAGAIQKEVEELTEMEKFCIAYFSGCAMQFVSDPTLHPLDPKNPKDGSRLRWSTKGSVGIVKEDGKFVCYQLLPEVETPRLS